MAKITHDSILSIYEEFKFMTTIKDDTVFLHPECPVEIRGELKHGIGDIKIVKEKFMGKNQMIVITQKSIIVIQIKKGKAKIVKEVPTKEANDA